MKRVQVNKQTCIAAGICVNFCPKSFVIDGPTATVIEPVGNTEAEIDAAIAACPTNSISWVEE